jgi:serine/threonine-protein kinase HipA
VASRLGLDVFAGTTRAGALRRSDLAAAEYLFAYRAECQPESAISLSMPVIADQYDSMGALHPIFEMNLPEGALLERLRLNFAKAVPDLDDLQLLAIVGKSQIGRLRYVAEGEMPGTVPARDLEAILTFDGAEDLFEDLLERYAIHSGVSGVQPKVLLRGAGSELARVTEQGATHIVKSFDSRRYPELAANEYFCLRAAGHAGIATSRARLAENRRILIVDRFDMTADGRYLGCEDFCVLNALRAHGRYSGSYELIAKRVGQFVSGSQQARAFELLFALIALSCAVENGDAHLKNFAVLYEDAENTVSLAPAFDVITTTVYQARDVLALTLANSKQFPSRAALTAFARSACGLSAARVKQVLERVERGVRAAQRDMRRYAKEHPDFAPAAERLSAAWERGLRRSIRG